MERTRFPGRAMAGLLLLAASAFASTSHAAGGYFVLGYGPYAHQSAGTSTAIGLDGFFGSTNPAKLVAVDDRLDIGVLVFLPNRRVTRSGSGTPFDFSSDSRQSFFSLPEAGFAKRINDRWSWGVTLYGNGGLNTNYPDDTGMPGTNQNPARCGTRPGNFFFGCGEVGFDLAQMIVAPTLAWKATPDHGFGVSALLAFQRFSAYGLQAFEPLSARPEDVSNNGYDKSLGAGIRVGWYGELLPQLTAGIAYSSRVYMQRFDRYDGLLADEGRFDIPAIFNVGLAYSPLERWTIGLDVRRIFYGEIRALSNGVQNSLIDPINQPLGSRNGSGFNWRHQTNYHGVIAFEARPTLTLRAGFAWGRRPQADNDINSVSFNMFAPNPIRNATIGFSKQLSARHELNAAYGRYIKGVYEGPSATPVGGQERVRAFVDTVMLAWSWRFGLDD